MPWFILQERKRNLIKRNIKNNRFLQQGQSFKMLNLILV